MPIARGIAAKYFVGRLHPSRGMMAMSNNGGLQWLLLLQLALSMPSIFGAFRIRIKPATSGMG
jgi:hypothetical protein